MTDKISTQDQARMKASIDRMREVSNRFYAGAITCGNHAFIEFCGLMNEYIKVCETAVDKGVDFTQASTHTGVALPFESYHRDYLFDKLDCIYGPSLAALVKGDLTKSAQQAGKQESLFQPHPSVGA